MEVVYFTGGTTGAGHLARGVAIGRALARRGFRGGYHILGPALDFPVAPTLGYEPIAIEKAALIDPRRARETVLATRLTALNPDVLVVDMFWALVQHILPSLDAQPWLLVRAAPPEWLRGPPQISFDPAAWKRVIGTEPIAAVGVREQIAPIVIANRDELNEPTALREHLCIPASQSVDVIAHAGKAEEIAALRALAPGAHVLDLRADDALFPAARWLAGADRITCGAGYNAYWEARWLGFDHKTRFHPFPRTIDDQARRVSECRAYPISVNGADVLAAELCSVE